MQGALATDKGNEELINLEVELKNLISLTKQLLGQAESSSSAASTSTKKTSAASGATTTGPKVPSIVEVKRFAAGDECQAKYAVSAK